MCDVIEIWIPLSEFEREHGCSTPDFCIKIKDLIVVYQLTDGRPRPPFYYSLEEAFRELADCTCFAPESKNRT